MAALCCIRRDGLGRRRTRRRSAKKNAAKTLPELGEGEPRKKFCQLNHSWLAFCFGPRRRTRPWSLTRVRRQGKMTESRRSNLQIAKFDLSLCICPSGTSLSTTQSSRLESMRATQEEKIISPIERFMATVVPAIDRSMKIGSALPQLHPDSQGKRKKSPVEHSMANLCEQHFPENPGRIASPFV